MVLERAMAFVTMEPGQGAAKLVRCLFYYRHLVMRYFFLWKSTLLFCARGAWLIKEHKVDDDQKTSQDMQFLGKPEGKCEQEADDQEQIDGARIAGSKENGGNNDGGKERIVVFYLLNRLSAQFFQIHQYLLGRRSFSRIHL